MATQTEVAGPARPRGRRLSAGPRPPARRAATTSTITESQPVADYAQGRRGDQAPGATELPSPRPSCRECRRDLHHGHARPAQRQGLHATAIAAPRLAARLPLARCLSSGSGPGFWLNAVAARLHAGRHPGCAAPPLIFSHPACLEHDTRDHPERADAHHRDRSGARPARLARLGAPRGAAGAAEALPAVHAERVRRARPLHERARRGARRRDRRRARGPTRRRARGRGGAAAWPTRCWPARHGRASARHARRATTPRRERDVGLLPLQQRRRRGAPRARRARRPSGSSSSTGTSTTATARTTSSAADGDVLFASIHQSGLFPGTGPLHDAGARGGEGFTINLPVQKGSGEDTWLSLLEHIAIPAARAVRAGPGADLGRATTPTATTSTGAAR